MGKQNGSVPGTFVSHNELTELNELLTTFRDYILSHEARIELIETWIGEFHAHNSTEGTEPAPEADGAEVTEAPATAEVYLREAGLLEDESTDDPS